MRPDRGPHRDHISRSPTALEPDSLEPGEVLDLVHDELHARAVPPLRIKVRNKTNRQLSEGGNALLLRADQPEADELDHRQTLWVPPRRRERVKVAVMEAYLNPAARQLLFGVLRDKARLSGRALWPLEL